jgi:hypothetical protein
MDDAKANEPVDIKDPAIHQEFTQIAANVLHRRRIGRAEIDEEDGFQRNG